MSTVGEGPGRHEVVGWMSRHGGQATAAVKYFYPEATGKDVERIAAKFRVWWQRHGPQGGARPAPPPPQQRQRVQAPRYTPPPPPPEDEEPSPEADDPPLPSGLAELAPVERLKWQLGQLEAQHAKARSRNDVRALTQLDARIAAVGQALDEARSREGKVTKLDRLPCAVAAEVLKKHKALAILAGAHERMDDTTEDRE